MPLFQKSVMTCTEVLCSRFSSLAVCFLLNWWECTLCETDKAVSRTKHCFKSLFLSWCEVSERMWHEDAMEVAFIKREVGDDLMSRRVEVVFLLIRDGKEDEKSTSYAQKRNRDQTNNIIWTPSECFTLNRNTRTKMTDERSLKKNFFFLQTEVKTMNLKCLSDPVDQNRTAKMLLQAPISPARAFENAISEKWPLLATIVSSIPPLLPMIKFLSFQERHPWTRKRYWRYSEHIRSSIPATSSFEHYRHSADVSTFYLRTNADALRECTVIPIASWVVSFLSSRVLFHQNSLLLFQ